MIIFFFYCVAVVVVVVWVCFCDFIFNCEKHYKTDDADWVDKSVVITKNIMFG